LTRALQALALAALAILFAAAGFLYYQWRSGPDLPDPAAAGQKLLAASLKGLDDRSQALDQWRGQVLVVNFWATWCAPCREEIPVFIQVQDRYRARGVQCVGIAIDQPERVRPYASEMGINYPLLVGGIETMEFAREIGNRAGVLPFTLVLDRSGRVAATHIGTYSVDALDKTLAPLL